MDKRLVVPKEARVPRQNNQPWASNWLFLKKPSTRREPPTMGKQLVIPEEAGVPGENHQPRASNWLFLQKPEYPEGTNHGKVTDYS
jgi:hypothetical protein